MKRMIVLWAAMCAALISSATTEHNLDSLLAETALPVLYMTTDCGKEPTGDAVYPPQGAWGVGLSNNEYLTGELTIKCSGGTVYSSGPYKKDTSGARIKLRGNTSAIGDGKKPYKIKLSKKSDLLFRGKTYYNHKEWVLLPAHDTKLIKFITGVTVGKFMGMEWEPGYEVVSLVLNGEYKGMYLLVDAVARDVSRCNVDKTGFIIEDDAYWWNEEVYFKGNILPFPVGYTFKYPDSDDVTAERVDKIRQYILDFEELLSSGGDLWSMMDVTSFASWLLAHDILGTGDSGGTNRYLYKYDYDPSSPNSTLLKMGPLWDFDAVFKNSGKWASIHNVDYSYYFPYLLVSDEFRNEYLELWNSKSQGLYSAVMDELNAVLETKGASIDMCKDLDSSRWWQPNNSFSEDVALVETWLNGRIEWLGVNISENFSSLNIPVHESSSEVKGIYSLQGVLLENISFPGMYVVDGKKILVK